ncbi:hypothetical protein BDV23DRAFT_180217 [Aspergillus alliaceus]|uniref:glucose oxidase n=1 Tax=Petromyces alliaceus TaxID=209559 RepID=A0A5N7CHX2_PETAA|nr:hypothetical protein BDV23DRAFT_180217 [Aspergillus alliaceus]
MSQQYRNPLRNPVHYTTPQLRVGPPATYSAAQRILKGYDYVIVGAGAAGSVLASKLSEDPKETVLLLEAGGDNVNIDEIKLNSRALPLDGRIGLRGRMIGGCTSMNSMIYHHCSKTYFDELASVHGCHGWSYDDLAPYFWRMERFTPSYSWLTESIEKGFLHACENVGIPQVPDINTPTLSSLATAYLPPGVRKRPNLFVACHVHVTKLLIDCLSNDDPTVFGVEFQTHRGGERPELLLLSGIGPEEELSKHRIPIVRANDAVGKNLKDHLATTTAMCKAKPGARLDYLGSTFKAMPSIARYKLFGGGPLSSNAGEAAAFFRSIGPDVESIGSPLAYIHHGDEAAPEGVGMFSLVPISLRPQRKGIITLNSRDAFDHPTIDPKYFSDAEDNDRTFLLVALRVSLRIMRSSALQQYLEPVPVNDDPWSYWWPYSGSDIDRIPDERLLRWMEAKALTLYHPVGTARMDPSPDTSVVDLQCPRSWC